MKLFSPLKNPNYGQPFGANPQDYAKFGYKGHDGQDYPEAPGTPIYAAHDGFLMNADVSRDYGIRTTIAFQDGGQWWMTLYGHLSKLNVPSHPNNFNDQSIKIKAGDLIGWTGNTGNSTGPHLHLGLFKLDANGNIQNRDNGYGGAIDPRPYLNALTPNEGENMFVQTMNYKGTVGIFIPADNQDHLKFLGKVYGKTIQVNDDNSITTDIKVD